MVDREKNLCYIVTVHYFIKSGEDGLKSKDRVFISLHSINTSKCRDFAKQKAEEDKRFLGYQEEWITGYTVPLYDYCK